jgi:cytochrome P450
MSSTAVSATDYDPFAVPVMTEPLPFYEQLRREQPVLFLPKYNGYFFSRFQDIVELLSISDNTFMQSEGSLPTPAALRQLNDQAPPPAADEPMPISQRLGMPIHSQVRHAHMAPLMPRKAAAMSGWVTELANARLDVLIPQRRFNLTREYGGIVSATVLTHLMGMPESLAGQSLDIINSGTRTDPELGGFDSAAVAQQAIRSYLPYVQARFDAGADGSVPMVDGMINYRYKGRALTPSEVAQQLVCAFIGGIETVPKIAAHGLMELASRPEQLAAVRADLEANTPKVAEEMIRFCAPAQWFMRTVHRTVTVAGQTMQPGQRAFYLVASALRDEREFDRPDEFIWNRGIPRTLAFGYGAHFCIGVHIARMEIKALVQTFLRRVSGFSFDLQAAERPLSSFQWGWNKLPVIIEQA